jgi:periplasmic protein CpxP/Spy
MTKRVLIAAGLAAVLAGAGAIAIAQSPQAGAGVHGFGRGFRGGGPGGFGADLELRGIDLTDAQRDQLHSIMESHKAEFEQVRTKVRAAHQGMAEVTAADTIDEAAIRAKSAEVAAAMADDAILRAKVRTEVFGILTAEQQQQVKDRRATRQQRMQERQKKQGERPQQ